VLLCVASALTVCSVELLLKIGTLLMEMMSYEKTLDSFIDLLRKDEVSTSHLVLVVGILFKKPSNALFQIRSG